MKGTRVFSAPVFAALLAGFASPMSWAGVGNTEPSSSATSVPASPEGQSVTLLSDGSRLLVGGRTAIGTNGGAHLLAPEGGALTPVGSSLGTPRSWHTATVLPDGKVLILGGVDSAGRALGAPELFDPDTRAFTAIGGVNFRPRSHHTATLLTSGAVFIVGGDEDAAPEIWDPRTAVLRTSADALHGPRADHEAVLLAADPVLISGGHDSTGSPVTFSEFYRPQQDRFQLPDPASGTSLGTLIRETGAAAPPPALAAAVPADRSTDIAIDAVPVLRFSRPLNVRTLTANTVSLFGPQGVVRAKVVAAEAGMLVFIHPALQLTPDASYTLFVRGAADTDGQQLPFTAIGFRTTPLAAPIRRSAAPAQSTSVGLPPEAAGLRVTTWQPGRHQLQSGWVIEEAPIVETAATLTAAAGVTALSGRVLLQNGHALPGVAVSVGTIKTQTDALGRFLLAGIAAGHAELVVNGRTANAGGAIFGQFVIGVDIKRAETTVLDHTIWMPVIDDANAVDIPSPTTTEVVITSPRIPGLELRIPKGTVIRERDGRIVTRVGITAVPTNRAPFPTPGFDTYFTIQPGGAYLVSSRASQRPQGATLIYPNLRRYAPDMQFDFLQYDPAGSGWLAYGSGSVDRAKGRVIPDDRASIYQFMGSSFVPGAGPPPTDGPSDGGCPGGGGGGGLGADVCPPSKNAPSGGGSCGEAGDPVDCATGLFIHRKTDLILDDVIPIRFTRTYHSSDTVSRNFGRGFSHNYNLYLYSPNGANSTTLTLVQPDGSRVLFDRTVTSPATGYADATFINNGTPSIFRGGQIVLEGSYLTLTLRNKEIYRFEVSIVPHTLALREYSDRNGNLLRVVPAGGSNPPIRSIVSPNGRSLTFTYAEGSTTRITRVTDDTGRFIQYDYDPTGVYLTKVTYPDASTEVYTYSSGRMVSMVNGRGITVVTNVYHSTTGRVTKQTLADGGIYLYNYTVDGSGRVTATEITDPRNVVERKEFNAARYVIKQTLALGTPQQQITTFTRDPSSQLVTQVVDPLNRITTYTYDAAWNLRIIKRLAGTPDEVTITLNYDPIFNQLTRVTDPRGKITTLSLDSRGNVDRITNPLNQRVLTVVTRDGQGRPTAIRDALNHTTAISYSGPRLSSVTDALGRTVVARYDGYGRLRTMTDPLGNAVSYGYDLMDRVATLTDPLNQTTAFAYDGNGNLTQFTDARGSVTLFTYDPLDRRQTRTDALSAVETFVWDFNGNLTQMTDRKGQIHDFVHDPLNRLSAARYRRTGSAANPGYESTISYTWDAGNRLRSAVDTAAGAGTVTLDYDLLDRLTSQVSPKGTVGYDYDLAGRRISMTASGQTTITYEYDDANRLTGLLQGGTTVGIGHDAAGRRTSLTLPNGVETRYGYDDANQLTGLQYRNGTTVIGTLTYGYDLAGRRVNIGGNAAQVGLPAAMSSASYDANNRLSQWGSTSYAYDANGNPVSSGSTSLTWNARNQLTAIGTTASFVYDGLGRRQQKTISGTTTGFVHDGLNVIQEQRAGAAIDLLTGLGIDETYARTDSAGRRSLLTDALGSTVALADDARAVRTQYAYEPYGATTQTGTSSTNSFKFTGREDDGLGLYYYRARYYNPSQGRFISEDPIGLAGGVNLYAYVSGNPISKVDPTGLADYLTFNGNTLSGYVSLPPTLDSSLAGLGKSHAWEFSVPATSGPWGAGRLPAGTYGGRNLRSRSDAAMKCPDGNGWSLDLDDKGGRSLLRIHPDGNVPGTLGCVGVMCGYHNQTYNSIRSGLMTNGGTVTLEVNYGP